jgi:hypothetical protein
MTAVDTLIFNLEQFRFSADSSPIIADLDLFIAALQSISSGLVPNIPTNSLMGRDTPGTGPFENILLNATLEFDGAGNLQRAALTGDITAPGGSNATTLTDKAVTYAKIQDVNVSKLIGRGSAAGIGQPVEISLPPGLLMSGTNLTIDAATQADQEGGIVPSKFVSVTVQQFHPSAAKCWANVTVAAGTPTLQSSYNITSITDTATGQLTITINVDFSTTNWCSLAWCKQVTAGGAVANARFVVNNTAADAAGTILIDCWDNTAATHLRADPAEWFFAGYGDQA